MCRCRPEGSPFRPFFLGMMSWKVGSGFARGWLLFTSFSMVSDEFLAYVR